MGADASYPVCERVIPQIKHHSALLPLRGQARAGATCCSTKAKADAARPASEHRAFYVGDRSKTLDQRIRSGRLFFTARRICRFGLSHPLTGITLIC